jgi:hypothetical protein
MFTIRIVAILVVLTACDDTKRDEHALADPGTTAALNDLILISDHEGVKWAAAEGYEVVNYRSVVDATGDGIDDLTVVVAQPLEGDDFAYTTLLMAGPVGDARVLPGDELVAFDGLAEVNDYNNDGVGDAKIVGYDDAAGTTTTGVIWGPLDDASQLKNPDLSVRLGKLDINGDGLLDDFLLEVARLSFWWAPLTLDAPADASVEFECESIPKDAQSSYWNWGYAFWPDVNGDGVADGYAAGFTTVTGCSQFVFPIPDSGTILTDVDDSVHTGIDSNFVAVHDQNGDNVRDLLVAGTVISAGPITFADGGLTDQNVLLDATGSEVSSLLATDYDVTDDAVADFLGLIDMNDSAGDGHLPGGTIVGVSSEAWAVTIVAGGGLVVSPPVTAWELSADMSRFAASLTAPDTSGNAWLVVPSSTGLTFHFVGVATEVVN